MRSIRGGRGLGDSLYVQSVARHVIKTTGERLNVCADYPDVFRPLGASVEVTPHRRIGVHLLAHYSLRKSRPETTQFQDCCIQAGLNEPVELTLDWTPTSDIGARIKECGTPIICVQLPRSPMARTDGFGADLLPNCKIIQRAIDRLKDRALIVQVGSGQPLFKFSGIDFDLANDTTVAEFIDIAQAADAFLGYVSFIVPLAESLNKPAMLVWSSKGLKSRQQYVRLITPTKVLHKPSSRYVVDDWPTDKIDGAIDAFQNSIA